MELNKKESKLRKKKRKKIMETMKKNSKVHETDV